MEPKRIVIHPDEILVFWPIVPEINKNDDIIFDMTVRSIEVLKERNIDAEEMWVALKQSNAYQEMMFIFTQNKDLVGAYSIDDIMSERDINYWAKAKDFV